MWHLILGAWKIALKPLCLSAPLPPGEAHVCLPIHTICFRKKQRDDPFNSIKLEKKIVPSCRLTLTVLKYIHNYLSHNSSHEKTTSWWNFSNCVVPCIWTRACYKQNLSSAKHKSLSHFKGKMPSFIASFPHDNRWVSTRYHQRNLKKIKNKNFAGNSAGAWCSVTPCFFFFFFECITLHQWYITFEMAMSCLAFFIKLFSSIKGGWGRRPFASFEGLFCMQS